MEIWVDTTDLKTVAKAKRMGILHGVTTNPNIIAASRRSLEDVLASLLNEQSGPVAVQVVAEDAEGMRLQGEALYAYSKRVIVKVPATADGLEAIHALTKQGIPVLATAIFDPQQALLSFQAGAAYLAPYVGRIGDEGYDPFEILTQIKNIQKHYHYRGKILAAGIRSPEWVSACAQMGLCAITLTQKVFELLLEEHPGTRHALNEFAQAWEQAESSRSGPLCFNLVQR